MTYAIAAISIQARLQLARAYAGLADVAGARTLLREAKDLMQRGQGFGVLEKQAAELASQLESVRAQSPGASSLTTAELRLLPLLPTHLSFREIGARLHLSRHTIKSQAISIYRKIDVTSRTEAVERARELGLL
jgi:LuxR family maltose regulon positive regulatory protein